MINLNSQLLAQSWEKFDRQLVKRSRGNCFFYGLEIKFDKWRRLTRRKKMQGWSRGMESEFGPFGIILLPYITIERGV